MRKFKTLILSGAFLGIVVSCAFALDDEVKVPLDQLPKAVRETVKAKFPDAELKEAAKETEKGKTSYEVSLVDKKAKIDVLLTPEGKITAIEKVIEVADLPKAVGAALKAKYPQGTVQSAEQLSDGDDTITAYEVIVELADKKKLEVKLAPDGKIMNEEKKENEEKKDKD